MKQLGYGREYLYEPNYAHPVPQDFLPPELKGTRFLADEATLEGKEYNEALLREWEFKRREGAPWDGRDEMMRKLGQRDT